MYLTKIPSLVKDNLLYEAYQIKHFVQPRFREITSLIKEQPKNAAVNFLAFAIPFLAMAWLVDSIVLPIFSALAYVLIDYLDNTYFYYKESTSNALQKMFNDLQFPVMPFSNKLEVEIKNPILRERVQKSFQERVQKLKEEELAKQKAYNEDPRPVLLFLRARSDHNGALDLYSIDRAITINGDNDKGVEELKKKYKIALIDNITSLEEIKERLERITNAIQQVWILAHGNSTSIELDGNNKIQNDNLDQLSPILQQKLAKDADVILCSCRTGQKVSSGENIATKLSKMLPGKSIWAPNVPTGIVTLDLGEAFSLKLNFWSLKSRLDFLIEKVWNICCFRPFKSIELKMNVTSAFKNGLEMPL